MMIVRTNDLLTSFEEELALAQNAAEAVGIREMRVPYDTGKLASSAVVKRTKNGILVTWKVRYSGYLEDDAFDVYAIEDALLKA